MVAGGAILDTLYDIIILFHWSFFFSEVYIHASSKESHASVPEVVFEPVFLIHKRGVVRCHLFAFIFPLELPLLDAGEF